jgi:hypothetical protein
MKEGQSWLQMRKDEKGMTKKETPLRSDSWQFAEKACPAGNGRELMQQAKKERLHSENQK